MPSYKLIYFNIRGKAEVIRFLFALSGVTYEDVRVERKNWISEKERIRPIFGQMPLLFIDDQVFCQSNSICKHLAQKFGYEGKTELDSLRANMIAHCVRDMSSPLGYAIIEEDPVRRENMRKKFVHEQLPEYCGYFERMLEENPGRDSGYFVGNSLTWADLMFFHYVTTYLPHVGVDIPTYYKNYPRQNALLESVPRTAKLAEYLARRPYSKF